LTWTGKGKLAFTGVGFSPIERNSTRRLGEFAEIAIDNALKDSGIERGEVDGLATFHLDGGGQRDGLDLVSPDYVMSSLRLPNVRWSCDLRGGMVTSAVVQAAMAVLGGACECAVVWRAMGQPAKKVDRANLPALQYVAGPAQFSEPWGCSTGIQWHALAFRRYLEQFGLSRDKLAALVLASRFNATLNENAIFNDRPLTANDYRDARTVSDPLSLVDCDMPVHACAAIVITTAERARSLKRPPAYLAGFSQNTSTGSDSLHYSLADYFDVGRRTADRLWRETGLQAGDMSGAMLYDGFAPSVVYWLEGAGFCERGEGLDFLQNGNIALGGRLPVNTFGGSLGQGRLHGIGHLAEAVLQVSRRAGPRQIRAPHAVCVFAGSPMYYGSGMVVTAEP